MRRDFLLSTLFILFFAGTAFSQGTWTYGEMPNDMLLRMGVAVSGSKIYLAGGARGDFLVTSGIVDVYDTHTGQWSSANLSVPREVSAGVACGGKLFFAGGINLSTLKLYDEVDICDTLTGQWSVARLSQPRMGIVAVTDGSRVLFAGGANLQQMISYATVDLYDMASQTWTTASLSEPRAGMGYAVAGNKALFAGGFNGSSVTDQVDLYDFQTGIWSTRKLSQARGFVSATAVGNKVIIAGGVTATNTPSDRMDIYDVTTDTWSTTSLSSARATGGAATACGKAFFGGGGNMNLETLSYTSASDVVDIYDPARGTLSTDKLPHPVFNLGMATCEEAVYFMGGVNMSEVFSHISRYSCSTTATVALPEHDQSCEIYPNPARNTVTIHSNGFIPEASVTICDVAGKVFYTHTFPETGKIVVDLTGIPSGLYVVRLKSIRYSLAKKLLVEK